MKFLHCVDWCQSASNICIARQSSTLSCVLILQCCFVERLCFDKAAIAAEAEIPRVTKPRDSCNNTFDLSNLIILPVDYDPPWVKMESSKLPEFAPLTLGIYEEYSELREYDLKVQSGAYWLGRSLMPFVCDDKSWTESKISKESAALPVYRTLLLFRTGSTVLIDDFHALTYSNVKLECKEAVHCVRWSNRCVLFWGVSLLSVFPGSS